MSERFLDLLRLHWIYPQHSQRQESQNSHLRDERGCRLNRQLAIIQKLEITLNAPRSNRSQALYFKKNLTLFIKKLNFWRITFGDEKISWLWSKMIRFLPFLAHSLKSQLCDRLLNRVQNGGKNFRVRASASWQLILNFKASKHSY